MVVYLIKFEADGYPILKLKTIEEIQEWAEIERDFWKQFGDGPNNKLKQQINEYVSSPFSLLFNAITNYNNCANNRAALEDEAQIDNLESKMADHIEAIETQLTVLYQRKKLPRSTQIQAKFFEELYKTNKITGQAAVLTHVNAPIEINNNEIVHGIVEYFIDINGGTSSRKATEVNSAIKETIAKLEKTITNTTDAANEFTTHMTESISAHDTSIAAEANKFSTLNGKITGAVKKQTTDTEERLKALEAEYNVTKALDAPNEYWNKKRKKHFFLTFLSLLLLLGYCVLLGYGGFEVFKSIPDFKTFWTFANSIKLHFSIVIALISISGTVIFTIARILLTQFKIQLHLYNDADERMVLIKTYLALRTGGHTENSENEYLTYVFERLFTPVADGLVRTDSAVTDITNAMKKLAGKK